MPLEANGIIKGDRGAEPGKWQHTPTTPSVTLTWHHTIPWNCLRAVWNGLVAGEHWEALAEFMQLISVPNYAGVLQQIKDKNVHDRDGLHTLVTWQGWNIVEGPGSEYRQQGDDPGEKYEHWSGKGMSGNQLSTLQQVNVLNLCMAPFAACALDPATNAPEIKRAEAEQLRRVIKQVRPTLKGKAPMLWKESMWHNVQQGKVDKKNVGKWATKPIWRRRLHTDLVQTG